MSSKINVYELEVGTKFRVVNGAWDGIIIEKNGVKYIEAYTTGYEKLVNTIELSQVTDLIIRLY